MNPPNALSICIVSHAAYGALRGDTSGHIGGVEWQTTLTARWLVERGHRVTMVTWNEGGDEEEIIDGIRVLKVCGRNSGIPLLRFVHPRWSSLWTTLKKADAQIYYHNCAEVFTGQIALWCRRNGRKFIFSAANDTDCDSRLPEFSRGLERWFYRFGLNHADRIIVQTKSQQLMLREGFGLESSMIPMPCAGQSDVDHVPRAKPPSSRVLWVARICQQKRPDRILDIAEACPDLAFDMAGPFYADGEQVVARARSIPNVNYLGAVPREKLGELYERAGCFCSTSDFEGFPNTFLEAWSHGLPIVSTFDPDLRIKNEQLGIVARTNEELIAGIRRLFSSMEFYVSASQNSRRYYANHHQIDAVLPQFEAIFQEVTKGSNSTVFNPVISYGKN